MKNDGPPGQFAAKVTLIGNDVRERRLLEDWSIPWKDHAGEFQFIGTGQEAYLKLAHQDAHAFIDFLKLNGESETVTSRTRRPLPDGAFTEHAIAHVEVFRQDPWITKVCDVGIKARYLYRSDGDWFEAVPDLINPLSLK